MKRELICKQCTPSLVNIYAKTCLKHPDEHLKAVTGCVASENLRCDQCGTPIKYGEPATAVSTWNDALTRIGRGYFEWERSYFI